MLKIYGADLSAPANKVRFVANYIGAEYEYIQVKIREGENRKESFLQMNPFGKIPTLDDDGFYLFESNAICRYLCDKYESELYPKDIKQRAVVDQWIDFSTIHIGGAMSKILFNTIFAPIIGVEVDARALEDGNNFLGKYLPVLEQHLGKNTYLTGESISLADITLLATLDPAEVVRYDLDGYKNIAAFRAKLKSQEFYTRCFFEYGEALKRMAQGKS